MKISVLPLEMTMTLDLIPSDLLTVKAILARFVPDKKVWAFGSRINGSARQY